MPILRQDGNCPIGFKNNVLIPEKNYSPFPKKSSLDLKKHISCILVLKTE